MAKIDRTITSKEGCTLHIVGDVELTWDLKIKAFHGTVTLGGGPGCPKGTLTFARSVFEGGGPGGPRKPDLLVTFDDPHLDRLKKIQFKKGTTSVPKMLIAKETSDRLVKDLVGLGSRMARDLKKSR